MRVGIRRPAITRRRRGDAERASEQFGGTPDDVGLARQFARSSARSWDVPTVAVEMVVGELASNAVLHACSPFTVTLVRRRTSVRVEVADRSEAGPVISDLSLWSTTGRGLLMVAVASDDRWGHMPDPGGGKVVWAEVAL